MNALLRRLLRLLHIVGLVMFVGGILACIVLNASGHLADQAEYVSRRLLAYDVTVALIVPGMATLLASGALLSWRGRLGLFARSWVGAKQVLGALVLANAILLIIPRAVRITAIVRASVPDLATAAPLQHTEDLLGGINLLLALGALVLAVWQPGAGRSGSSTPSRQPATT